MCDYLTSNCDRGCKTVWSGVLKCIMEDSLGLVYRNFHRSDIIYMHVTSFMMSLESCDHKCYHLAQNTWVFPQNCYN